MGEIRVVARIRPQQDNELAKDSIVSAASADGEPSSQPTLVRIPSFKNENENYTFQFSSVYDQFATQQSIFDKEILPTIKHLFNGLDVTLFAYGVTGTGKTHTMRGGKSLSDRGIIPRLLSSTYRRCRKIEKESRGETSVSISLSYYEIYNDKVFDLLEAPEKRTLAGLQLRDNGGKTVVVGLTERPCESLKEFEKLYDQANVNRSTSATKLNAHSSRSHAILCFKVTMTTGEKVQISTASAIDLAGSEDNRRTDNGKDRLVESASINKSLFVLAKCVEAISQKQARIPYRESKMTRILSLGQNNGLTVMILNLAPSRSYHLDTISSLNFANRTKKIEVREIENEPIIKGCSRAVPSFAGTAIQRQPLRPLAATTHNASIGVVKPASRANEKPTKAFSVYSDGSRYSSSIHGVRRDSDKRSSPLKRPLEGAHTAFNRPAKRRSPDRSQISQRMMSKEAIEDMIEKKVTDILAARALDPRSAAPVAEISDEVQRRLEQLEQKIECTADGREQGLSFLLMAKQHAVRGEDTSALRMFTLARGYFPDNAKLNAKIDRLKAKLREGKDTDNKQAQRIGEENRMDLSGTRSEAMPVESTKTHRSHRQKDDDDYRDEGGVPSEDEYNASEHVRCMVPHRKTSKPPRTLGMERSDLAEAPMTPRTKQLLDIVNSRDVGKIRALQGIGAKRAEAIVEALCVGEEGDGENRPLVRSLDQLGGLRGVGVKTVEKMKMGLDRDGVGMGT